MVFTLEEALEGKEPEVEEKTEEVAKEVTEEVKAEAETEEETTEEPTGEEPEETAPPAVESKSQDVPIQALLDERDKRKDAQAKLADFEKKAEEQKEKTSFWDDPEAAREADKAELREEFEQKLQTSLLAMSTQSAATRHGDEYQEAKDKFLDAAEKNPYLVKLMWQEPDPGEYIWKVGKQMADFDAVGGDLNTLKQQVRAEVLAELKENKNQTEEILSEVPESLTETQSTGSPREKVEGGPTPLGNIIRND